MTLSEKLYEKSRCDECGCDEGLDVAFSFAHQPGDCQSAELD